MMDHDQAIAVLAQVRDVIADYGATLAECRQLEEQLATMQANIRTAIAKCESLIELVEERRDPADWWRDSGDA